MGNSLMLMGCGLNAVMPGTIDDDIMGYWNCDQAAGADIPDQVNRVGDSGSSDHDLSEQGTCTVTDGVISGAVEGDTNTSNRYSLNNEEDFECGTDDFSVWFWLKMESYTNGMVWDMFNSPESSGGWGFYPYGNGNLYFYFNTVGEASNVAGWSGFDEAAGTDWHLWIVNVSRAVGSGKESDGDGKMSVCMDGPTVKYSMDITDHDGNDFTMSDNQVFKNADALVDEVGWMVGDRLTDKEMTALYNNGKGMTYYS